MNYASIILVLNLVSEAFGALKEIDALVKRVERGEAITDKEIEKARDDMKASVNRWKNPKT